MSGGGANEHNREIPRRRGSYGGEPGVEEEHWNRWNGQFPTKGRVDVQPAEVFCDSL